MIIFSNLPDNFWNYKITDVLKLAFIVFGLLWSILKSVPFIYGKYISIYPFKIEIPKKGLGEFICQKFYSKTLIIMGINDMFPKTLIIKIKPKEVKIFEKIQIKFEERFWFSDCAMGRDLIEIVWCHWRNVSSNIVDITGLSDLNIVDAWHRYNTTHIADQHKRIVPKYKLKSYKNGDKLIGEYAPPYNCPKGDFLSLKISLDIKVKTTWKGYISFQHILGDERITTIRQKIIIKNQQDMLKTKRKVLPKPPSNCNN